MRSLNLYDDKIYFAMDNNISEHRIEKLKTNIQQFERNENRNII